MGNRITILVSLIVMQNLHFVFHVAMTISLSHEQNLLATYKKTCWDTRCCFLHCYSNSVSSWCMLMYLEMVTLIPACSMHWINEERTNILVEILLDNRQHGTQDRIKL
jgi:hypothetical protein